MTTAPAKPRPRPATMCSSSIRPAARRCCRSTAARSRPIGGSPKRRWNGLRPICAAPRRAKAGPANRRCPAAIWTSRRSPALTAELLRDYPFLTPAHASRLAHAYGTRATKMLGDAKSMADLGQSFGATLTESEVRYLMAKEWALTAEDIVWRRSKLGLRLSAAERSPPSTTGSPPIALTPESPLREAGGRT